MTDYNLYFVNNSNLSGNACVYQDDPDIGVTDCQSLAWFAKEAAPTTSIDFGWSIDYSFVWSESGELQPGVVFTASQSWATDSEDTANNGVTFTNADGAYTFANQGAGGDSGSLYITEDGSIGVGECSVGIGMSGSGTFAVDAEPNMNLVFTPHPVYYITFGDYTQGEVMDISEITDPQEIDFPVNVYEMTATLNADNTWTVTQGAPSSDLKAKAVKVR